MGIRHVTKLCQRHSFQGAALAFQCISVTFPQGIDTNVANKADKAMSRNELTKAIAYFRTSSETNVGADKDTLKRQREAVTRYAKTGGYEIIAE
jgi:predicted site-specific integrase-resolvase